MAYIFYEYVGSIGGLITSIGKDSEFTRENDQISDLYQFKPHDPSSEYIQYYKTGELGIK